MMTRGGWDREGGGIGVGWVEVKGEYIGVNGNTDRIRDDEDNRKR